MDGTRRVACLGVLAVAACAWYGSVTEADLPVAPGGAGRNGLVSQVIQQDGRPPAVLVTDPANSVLAVYHVDPMSGELSLKSVRNVTWDLKMLHYNIDKEDPTPKDVRAGIQNY